MLNKFEDKMIFEKVALKKFGIKVKKKVGWMGGSIALDKEGTEGA